MALESLIPAFKALCATLPDRRKGENTVYEMDDIGMAAFVVFFMQSPSFLAQQTALERGRGSSSCQTLFAMRKIPADNHIRSMLDPVPPETLFPMFGKTLAALEEGGGLAAFQRLGGHVLLVGGAWGQICPAQTGLSGGRSFLAAGNVRGSDAC